MGARLDLNADLGESFGRWPMGDDEALLSVVTSANVACGFHAGDPSVLLATCRAAAERDVTVGAHVGYRDLVGFGRVFIDVEPERLYADVLYQLAAIAGVADVAGARLGYVKPHGALYNTIVHHQAQAEAVVGAVADFGRRGAGGPLALLGLPGSVSARLAEAAGLRAVGEAFVDRAYRPDGTLVSRREPGAVLHEVSEIVDRVTAFARTGLMRAADGSEIALEASSLCVHGDTPDAVGIARAVRAALEASGIELSPFA